MPVLFYCAELTPYLVSSRRRARTRTKVRRGDSLPCERSRALSLSAGPEGKGDSFAQDWPSTVCELGREEAAAVAQAKEDSKHKMCRFCVLPAGQPNETSPEWIAFVLYARYECQARAGEFDSRAFAWSCSLDKFRPIGFTRRTTANARPRGTERRAARRGKKWAQRGIDTEPTNSIAKPFDPTLYPATWFKILSSTHTNGGDARP